MTLNISISKEALKRMKDEIDFLIDTNIQLTRDALEKEVLLGTTTEEIANKTLNNMIGLLENARQDMYKTLKLKDCED